MKKYLSILILCILPIMLFSQDEEGRLRTTITLYDSQDYQPAFIYSDGGWTEIGQIIPDKVRNLTPPSAGSLRKWRIRTTYIDESPQGQSTLQIQLKQKNSGSPVFTLPWTEKGSRWQEKNSNWYIPFTQEGSLIEENATLAVRLIAPPRSNSPGKVYKIELEAWDFQDGSIAAGDSTPAIRMAFSSPAALMSPDPARTAVKHEEAGPGREEALKFALSFVQFNLEGNLPGFYKSLDDQVHILNTGLSQSKYRVAPPADDLSTYSIGDYKNSYRHHLYSYDEYAALFPSWINPDRRWTPDTECYLFLGTELKPGKEDFIKGENLVFMVKYIEGEWKITGIPE